MDAMYSHKLTFKWMINLSSCCVTWYLLTIVPKYLHTKINFLFCNDERLIGIITIEHLVSSRNNHSLLPQLLYPCNLKNMLHQNENDKVL